jgi:hypothetical protein
MGGFPGHGASGKAAQTSAASELNTKSENRDPADANGDGKVSAAEQLAYDLKHPKHKQS